jgi:hypothetical protein
MVFRSALSATFGAGHFAAARTEDRKLRKDPYYLEVLALKVPFGTSSAKLALLSESNPVAGTIENRTPLSRT